MKYLIKASEIYSEDLIISDGSLVVSDGRIAEISQGKSQLAQADDLGGDFLMPGLVELHTDNQEKYFTPRPKVDWPAHLAMATHDAQQAERARETQLASLCWRKADGTSWHGSMGQDCI